MPPEEVVPPHPVTPVPGGSASSTPVDPAPSGPGSTESFPTEPPPARRRSVSLGLLAFVLAAVLVVAEGVAVYLAGAGEYLAGTIIGQVLLVATAVPFILGLYAVARRRNRAWGIAAAAVSLVANPLILTRVLDFFGGL